MKAPKIRASLIEIYRRFTPLEKNKATNLKVYLNGEDNLYPSKVDAVISNSPTGKRAAQIMAKFIGGAGIEDENGELIPYKSLPFVNKKKQKVTDLINIAKEDIARQNGVFIHVGYGINALGRIVPTTWEILEYSWCRISNEDAQENNGMVLYHDWECKDVKKKPLKFYPFNNDEAVVKAQIMADAKSKNYSSIDDMITHYRGQVYYLNLTPAYKYAISPFDAVYNDMDTEGRISTYSNTEVRTGFLGKTIFITQGLDEEKSKEIDRDLAKFMGETGSANIYSLDVAAAENLDNVLKVIQLKPQFDDKLFEVTDKRLRRNILGAANNLPEAMVNASDGALFGVSGDTYREMKLFYSEQTEEEREKLQEALTHVGLSVKIRPIVKADS